MHLLVLSVERMERMKIIAHMCDNECHNYLRTCTSREIVWLRYVTKLGSVTLARPALWLQRAAPASMGIAPHALAAEQSSGTIQIACDNGYHRGPTTIASTMLPTAVEIKKGAMAYQNRVNPFGQIVATSARGNLMGNRGCLHDTGDRPVRQYQSRRWISCVLDFKGRARKPMPPGQYTSLFFLDEATALAAGHRPCAECQRERFNLFCAHWAATHPERCSDSRCSVDIIDRTLHAERISDQHYQRQKTKTTYTAQLSQLPNGTFITLDAAPYVVHDDTLLRWSFEGYRAPIARLSAEVQVLTPHSIVQTLTHGYLPLLHPTATSR